MLLLLNVTFLKVGCKSWFDTEYVTLFRISGIHKKNQEKELKATNQFELPRSVLRDLHFLGLI